MRVNCYNHGEQGCAQAKRQNYQGGLALVEIVSEGGQNDCYR